MVSTTSQCFLKELRSFQWFTSWRNYIPRVRISSFLFCLFGVYFVAPLTYRPSKSTVPSAIWISEISHLVSPFDEKLAEDRRVNRLEDTYLLWRSVCACKLLARTQIILCNSPFCLPLLHQPTLAFRPVLNKCDLLQAKLQRGVRIRDSVPSFGDRKNDLPTATRCASSFIFCTLFDPCLFCPDFQTHFKEIARQHSTVPRPFYVHLTSVIVRIHLLFMGFTQDARSFVPRLL